MDIITVPAGPLTAAARQNVKMPHTAVQGTIKLNIPTLSTNNVGKIRPNALAPFKMAI